MKKIIGGKEKSCEFCGGTIVYLKVKGLGIVSNCKECGSCTKGKSREIKIYTYEGDK